MAIKRKPDLSRQPAKPYLVPEKLMDNVDRVNRGDGTAAKIHVTVTMDPYLKKAAQEYARMHGTSLSYLVERGLECVLAEE